MFKVTWLLLIVTTWQFGRRDTDATWNKPDAIGMGPGETVDMWDQHRTHAICSLTWSSCTARRSHGVWSKRKKLTLNIFHFHFLLPLHECNYEHNFLTSMSSKKRVDGTAQEDKPAVAVDGRVTTGDNQFEEKSAVPATALDKMLGMLGMRSNRCSYV